MPQRRPPRPKLKPRDYAEPDYAYGTDQPIRWATPPGGDDFSRNLARLQHEMVFEVENLPDPRASQSRPDRKDLTDRNAVAPMCRRWRFSRSYWQRCTTGESWFDLRVLAGATDLLRQRADSPTQSPG